VVSTDDVSLRESAHGADVAVRRRLGERAVAAARPRALAARRGHLRDAEHGGDDRGSGRRGRRGHRGAALRRRYRHRRTPPVAVLRGGGGLPRGRYSPGAVPRRAAVADTHRRRARRGAIRARAVARHAAEAGVGKAMADITVPDALPILPLREAVVFPLNAVPLSAERAPSVRLIDDVMRG